MLFFTINHNTTFALLNVVDKLYDGQCKNKYMLGFILLSVSNIAFYK